MSDVASSSGHIATAAVVMLPASLVASRLRTAIGFRTAVGVHAAIDHGLGHAGVGNLEACSAQRAACTAWSPPPGKPPLPPALPPPLPPTTGPQW